MGLTRAGILIADKLEKEENVLRNYHSGGGRGADSRNCAQFRVVMSRARVPITTAIATCRQASGGILT